MQADSVVKYYLITTTDGKQYNVKFYSLDMILAIGSFWRENVNRLLEFQGKEVLQGKGSISKEQMETRVARIYDEFDLRRKG